jgi:hypothetical protein
MKQMSRDPSTIFSERGFTSVEPVASVNEMIRMKALDAAPSIEDATSPTLAGPTMAPAGRLGSSQQSAAELLQQLRREFPDSPLAVRVRALEALRRR